LLAPTALKTPPPKGALSIVRRRRLSATRVLVFEPYADLAELMTCSLRDEGADVTVMRTVTEAVAFAVRTPPDVVVAEIVGEAERLDIVTVLRSMPDRRLMTVPIVLTTSRPLLELPRPIRKEAMGWLQKPFDIDALAAVVAFCAGRCWAAEIRLSVL
jgi:DNA-binding NtrC family response regulator